MFTGSFWIRFISIAALALFALGLAIIWRIDRDSNNDALIFDIPPNADVDPFQKSLHSALPTPILYDNGLGADVVGSSWGARTSWKTVNTTKGDNVFIHAAFDEPWSGMYLGMPLLESSSYQGITFSLLPSSGIQELYVDLYDASGRVTSRQPLAWYMPGHTLNTKDITSVSIPLQNLNVSAGKLSGIALISETPGSLDVYKIHFSKVLAVASELRLAPVQIQTGNAVHLTNKGMLPYEPVITSALSTDWLNVWGSFVVKDGALILNGEGTLGGSPGSFALYLNGADWGSYVFETTAIWGSGETISLAGRYVDEKNYVSCGFSREGLYVQIFSVVNGISEVIAKSPELQVANFGHTDPKTLALKVQGKRLTCILDGTDILSAPIPTMSEKGTVGIETWDPLRGNRAHTVTEIRVREI